ncbi:unnamed protein product [Rotaria magnacalcarata]|uniref:Hermes trasposase DNA-binding domain-containing protein n=1 Tax=Rotaria magnacalcarata TaxID=392030 RepID=A0A816GVR2_9BILA|nr:unnamed protein product [Rotaria magnacalcarata]CAF1680206.1 unnamed protein product [Rotaria magnacalcarata]CAF2074081.1 unnamed protein product [Rotaria magnacalcarata]CAF3833674.1 unnamed protein product [Rotaria magnacalcarata]CAF3838014.1 unnamed protein product [Rotaria magnacalcarata]
MSCTARKELFSKQHYQNLIVTKDSSIKLKKPPSARSELWSNFSQVYHSDIAQDYIVCHECHIVLKWTSETEDYSTIKERIVESYAEFCALDNKTFETVAGDGFISLAKQLMNAGALIGTGFSVNELLPHPTTVSRNVTRTYNKLKQQLILFCENVQHFTITCDFWTESLTGTYPHVFSGISRVQLSLVECLHYGGISLHFVDVGFNLQMFILACKLYDLPNQKAYNIRDFVNIVVEEFGLKINEDIFIVSDNESKMVAAFRDGVIRIGCSAHYINKVIQHAFELEEPCCSGVQALFSLVRDIITYVRQIHKQSSLSICVQNYCKIRFSNVYIMFNTFVMVYNELPSILNTTQRQNYLKINYVELEQLTRYLTYFHDVIEKLSCERTPTVHLVVSYKQFLLNKSKEHNDDCLHLVQLKRYISKHFNDYWIIHDIHYIAMLLHPNLKSYQLIPDKKNMLLH